MINNALDSIQSKYCAKTNQSYLDKIQTCKNCSLIPLPSYRSYIYPDKIFCKKCYHSLNKNPKHLIIPSETELQLLEKLIISCINYEQGCMEEFSMTTLEELLFHQQNCKPNLITSSRSDIKARDDQVDQLLTPEFEESKIQSPSYNEPLTKLEDSIKSQSLEISQLKQIIKIQRESVGKEIEEVKNANSKLIELIKSQDKEIEQLKQSSQIQKQSIEKEIEVIKSSVKVLLDLIDSQDSQISKLKQTQKDSENKIIVHQNNNSLQERIINLVEQKLKNTTENKINSDSNITQKTQLVSSKSQENIITDAPQTPSVRISDLDFKFNSQSKDLILNNNSLNISRVLEINFKDLQNIDSFHNKEISQAFLPIQDSKRINNDLKENRRNEIVDYQEELQNDTIQNYITLIGHKGTVYALIELNDSKIASASKDGTIKIWDLKSKEFLFSLTGHQNCVNSLIRLDDEKISSASWDKTIKVWDLNLKKCILTLNGHNNYVYSLILLKDGKLASCSKDQSIKIWDLNKKECIQTLNGHTFAVFSLIQLNNLLIASCSVDQTIKLWDLDVNKNIATLKGHSDTIYSIVQLKDGNLASASRDKTIKIWNLNTKECVFTLTGHSNFVYCLIQLKNARLASASEDNTIKLWDLATNKCLHTLQGHNDYVFSLIQLYNGSIASASNDCTIKIWG